MFILYSISNKMKMDEFLFIFKDKLCLMMLLYNTNRYENKSTEMKRCEKLRKKSIREKDENRKGKKEGRKGEGGGHKNSENCKYKKIYR